MPALKDVVGAHWPQPVHVLRRKPAHVYLTGHPRQLACL